ncbi:MAG: ankyrin repeat domain-containing protein [Myxococcales bacterium]|nr:ankyrin repeat domain-containing protein [Myxococcales bacterium]
MEWDHAAYPPEVLRCSFGDRAREGDGASWRALAEQFEDHAWVIAAPEVREPRSAAPSLSIWTYTMHAARRHDVPVAERRVLEEMRWLVGQLSTWAERIGRELELTYEGEEIGWIVRGEVSEELRRFLDRWERTLRDDVASRVQRDEGRVDDGDEGKVSIWLGDLRDEAELAALLVPASPARSPLRRALGLRTVPEGELEARWAPRAPVGALLAPMSFGASFADAVAAVARARSIDTASAVIAYFDHAHEPAQALPEQDGARLRFVGVFSYDEAVEARPASEVEPMPARLATQVRPWRHYLPRLHDHRAATAERLDTLERSLGATLPPDYRVFLRHLGGAVPSAGTLVSPIDDLAWKAGPVAVGEFLGFRIDGGPALDPFGRIPVDLLPIARTEGDDRFCLGIGGSYRDEVWLWAHDAPRAAAASSEGPWHECLYRVAATFAAFLERLELRPWEDSPVLDPEGVDVDAVIARSRAVAASVGQVRAAVKRSTRVVRSTAAADGAFARLVAEAPDVAIGVVRGMVPVGDADAIDVPAVAADVAHALWADAEIRNGGVAQLLHNGGRQQVERSRAALRALGLARPAAILRMAVGEGGEVELDEIDEAWYGLDPSLQAAIASVLAAQQAPWFERLAAHADVRRRVAALTPADQLAVAIDLGDLARLERLARAAPGAVTPALLTQAVEKRSTTSRVAIVERLLAASPGADLRTLLRTAISAASPGMVRVLLHHGADVAPDPATGATPLAAARDVETARLLIAAGVSARIADHAGRTALHFAGSVDVVRVLLSAGADARVVDATGATVLHHALDAAAIDLLIQHGAEPDREDAAGVTPLMRQADPESMAALARHGASYDSVDRRGRTALHHHAGDRCTQHLLTIGLDPLRSDAAGETPLALARANDHFGGRYVRMHEVAADIEPDPGPPTPPVAEPRPDVPRHRR